MKDAADLVALKEAERRARIEYIKGSDARVAAWPPARREAFRAAAARMGHGEEKDADAAQAILDVVTAIESLTAALAAMGPVLTKAIHNLGTVRS